MATNGEAAATVAQAKLNGMHERDESKGAKPHTFDSDATPEQKAASALKGQEQLKSIIPKKQTPQAKEMVIDTAKASTSLPAIKVTNAEDSLEVDVSPPEPTEDQEDAVPGNLAATVARTIPSWYKTGWREVGGIDAPISLGEMRDKGILETFVDEQFYGEWYHNAAIIFFAVFSSHFATRFGFGWGWLIVLLAICNTYYSTSMRRLRHRARDDIQRELLKSGLISEHETAEWLNNFLERFWKIYEPVLSATIVSTVDQVLSTSTPAFLDSLRLSEFTLGNKNPRIDKVRTFPKTDDDVVMMDWSLSFTPNDVSDLTHKESANKVNPKIVLEIRVGAGLATAPIPIILEDLMFKGLMRIRLKLMTNFPHVQVVDLCFLEEPTFDYVLKPLGGDAFGFDIAHIPGLAPFIRNTVHANLRPMMYEPNVFTLNLEQMLSGAPIDTAIGVLQVTLRGASGIKATKFGGGSPDPYVKVSLNNRETVAKTKYKHSTYNPTWSETKILLIKSLKENLILTLWDYNEHRKDSQLGVASYDLSTLLENASIEDIVAPILNNGKASGEIKLDLAYYPVLKPALIDGVPEELPETSVGIVRVTVHQARDLDQTKSMSGELNPFAKVFLGNERKVAALTTPIRKHTNSPVWESSTEYLCTNRSNATVTFAIIDDRDFLKDPIVGSYSMTLDDLIASKAEAGKDWFTLNGCKTGKVRVSAEWKPLDMAGSLEGADKYKAPIGTVRLHLVKATDVKNVESGLGGKSDPYMRVQINNVTKGRTEVKNNNLSPEWDEILYIPVHSIRENLLLECMDYQNLGKDRSLGSVVLHVNELAKASDADPLYRYASIGKKTAQDPIRFDRSGVYKGVLHYDAEFIPAIALDDIEFEGVSDLDQVANPEDSSDEEEAGDVPNTAKSDKEMPIPTLTTTRQAPPPPQNVVPAKPVTSSTPISPTKAPVKGHTKNTKSVDTVSSVETAKATGPPLVHLSKEELLKHQSGILIVHVVSGSCSKRARLEVLLDSGYWPAFSTTKARTTHNNIWSYVGEAFVKELDFGRIWLRLNQGDEWGNDEIVAEYKGDIKPFLESTLSGKTTFTLTSSDERQQGTVVVECRYAPSPVKLDPREMASNQGTLHIDLLDGKDLLAADRGGKSDPYAVFTLNGVKVFKSDTKKKTLNPVWNENFDVTIPSRVAAEFEVEVYDWDQLGTSDRLGVGKIEVADLEEFAPTERVITLTHPKHGQKGSIRIRMVFRAAIIAKTRKNTSTFSQAGRAMTQVAGLPLGVGKGVAHGVGGIFRKDKDSAKQKDDTLPAVPEVPSAQGVRASETDASAGYDVFGSPERNASTATGAATLGAAFNEPGTLTVTVLSAKDLVGDAKIYVGLKVGDKEHKTKHTGKGNSPDWNETFTFPANTSTTTLVAHVLEHKTIGKDKLLGEAGIDIWKYLKPGRPSSDVVAQLQNGTGTLSLKLEFNSEPQSGSRASTVSALDRSSFLNNSPSKFSLKG